MTGYEFELNHDRNLSELRRQKMWAQVQLRSCNENNRFQHTQTTACIVAVNGRLIGPYDAESLFCYGTNPGIPGLRVTMTVYEGEKEATNTADDERGKTKAVTTEDNGNSKANNGGNADGISVSNSSNDDGGDNNGGEMPVLRNATLELRYQIIFGKDHHHHHGRHYHASCGHGNHGSHNHQHQCGHQGHHHYAHSNQNRYLFATTVMPLHAGVAARPGYRPVEAAAAAERIRQWGGRPDSGVFGNAWLVHMAIEPGHVRHVVDAKVMEQAASRSLRVSGGVGHGAGNGTANAAGSATMPSVMQTMRMVNERMAQLVEREGTLSVLLSNHATQKRIARQCPDLVAMWVMAQENL